MDGWTDGCASAVPCLLRARGRTPAFCPIDRKQTDRRTAGCLCLQHGIHRTTHTEHRTQHNTGHTETYSEFSSKAHQRKERSGRHVCVRPASPWVPSVAWHRNWAPWLALARRQADRQPLSMCTQVIRRPDFCTARASQSVGLVCRWACWRLVTVSR